MIVADFRPIEEKEVYITHKLQDEGIGDGKRPYFYGSMSGTSMATPMVTGIVALWLQVKPDLTVADVRVRRPPTESTDLTERLAENILPQISQILHRLLGCVDLLRNPRISQKRGCIP